MDSGSVQGWLASSGRAICIGGMVIALAGCQGENHQAAPDRVLVNGTVLTLDATDTIAEAIAIAGDVIAAVGSTAEIEALAGPATERIDLAGRAVTPGLLDAHAHFSPGPSNRLDVLDLSYPKIKSIAEVQVAVAERAQQSAADGWIQGRGWDEGKLAERRRITARDLDAVESERPVWLSQTMGHYGTANSAALRLAKIGPGTPDPPGGTIERDADGNPTGILKETAQELVFGLIPPPTPDEIERGIRELAAAFNAEGMTGVKDPGITDDAWEAYARVLAADELTVRVFALWDGGRSIDEARGLIAKRAAMTRPYERRGDDRLIAGGVKLFADGSGGARTAWMYDDWNLDVTGTDVGNRGYPNIEPDTLRAMIRLYHDAGLHISTHAIGDRAIDLVVDSYLEAMRANPKPGLRHGIIHANVPTEHALEAMVRLQRDYDAGYPEPSATFMWWIGDTYAGNFGLRARQLDPFATFQKRGIRWANGSDYSVTPFPARYGIWAAVAREPALGIYGGDPFGREEAVDARTALRAATVWAAHQMFLEQQVGSIEVGKYADLAVWDRNPLRVATADLKDMQCELTLLGGKVVFEADGARSPR
ncbi:MAG: amidohydrolase [Deltaproteobacteria bacterium]|jgi:predicted amidohydrolase YtcJ|nr:amidohydrolase [Deltaproteobacteria bacterium]